MQLSIFNLGCEKPYKIKKPIRLIELFGGIGSQAKALENLQANFTHYRLCEFDKFAIQSYNAVHGTNFATSDITKITADDLGIVDTDKYEYIMTYSFPCQDLSIAGKQAGMKKGSGTRSGLLWEVERLLEECEELPQILLMENVPQVHGKKNEKNFYKWIEKLESLGYRNYWQDLNAKNYGIPQNRNRTFMVSVLGKYYYDFPKPKKLKLRLKDMLESNVDEKYYIKNAKVKTLLKGLDYENADKVCCDMTINQPRFRDIANTIKARYDCGIENIKQTGTAVIEPKCEVVATLNIPGPTGVVERSNIRNIMTKIASTLGTNCGSSTSAGGGVVIEPIIIDDIYKNREPREYGDTAPTLRTNCNGLKVAENYRIRKLTPKECWRLMGFSDKDFYAAHSAGVSNSQLYKQAGNSIVVNVLEEIFKKLF